MRIQLAESLRREIERMRRKLDSIRAGPGLRLRSNPDSLTIELIPPSDAQSPATQYVPKIVTLTWIAGSDGGVSGTLTTLSTYTYTASNTLTTVTFCTAQALTFPRYSGAGVQKATMGLILQTGSNTYDIIDSNEWQEAETNCSA